MSTGRGVFPLAAPAFDAGKVTVTLRAKERLARKGLTPGELLDRFLRFDWPDTSAEDFGWSMEAARQGKEFWAFWQLGRKKSATAELAIVCKAGKFTAIETGSEYMHRLDPKHYGPEDELPAETWGKGRYTAPPCEIVKAAGTEEDALGRTPAEREAFIGRLSRIIRKREAEEAGA